MGFSMSNIQTFFGPPAVTAIVGGNSTTATDSPIISTNSAFAGANNLRRDLAGALTANTWKAIVNVTGPGYVNFAAAIVMAAASQTLGVRVTLDGVVVGNRSVPNMAANGRAVVLIGAVDSSNTSTTAVTMQSLRFNKSLLIELQSSLTETDSMAIIHNYTLT
jgi:hypothetical protein